MSASRPNGAVSHTTYRPAGSVAEERPVPSPPRRPLPNPASSRRALPTPPTTGPPNLPQSRSGRALPQVPPVSNSDRADVSSFSPNNDHRPTYNEERDMPSPMASAARPTPNISHQIEDDWSANGRGTPTQSSWLEATLERTRLQSSNPYSQEDSPQEHSRRISSNTMPGYSINNGHLRDGGTPASNRDRHHHLSPDDSPGREDQGNHQSPHRQPSTRSSLQPSILSASRRSMEISPSWHDQQQAPSAWVERKLQIHASHRAELYDDESVYRPESQYDDDEEWEEEEAEVDESRFFNRALLSEMAVQVKDKVNMGRHTKAGIAWVGSFTGKDVVVSHPSQSLVSANHDRPVSKGYFRPILANPMSTDGMPSSVLILCKTSYGLSKSIGTSSHFVIPPRMSFASWVKWKGWVAVTHSLESCQKES
jgi:hypothetical protein